MVKYSAQLQLHKRGWEIVNCMVHVYAKYVSNRKWKVVYRVSKAITKFEYFE
jgi:hypothetical protein